MFSLPRNTSPSLSALCELPRNPKKRRKSWTIVVRIGDVSRRDTSEEGGRIEWGSGERDRSRGFIVEGGIYEIAGHPPSATTVNSGDRWAVALTYVRVQGMEKSESRVHSRTPCARAPVCMSCPGHPGFRGDGEELGETESLKSRDQNAIGRRRNPASPC